MFKVKELLRTLLKRRNKACFLIRMTQFFKNFEFNIVMKHFNDISINAKPFFTSKTSHIGVIRPAIV